MQYDPRASDDVVIKLVVGDELKNRQRISENKIVWRTLWNKSV